MNDSKATYVATCHPFIATESILRQRRLARQAKERRDPGSRVILENLVMEIRAAIASFVTPPELQLEAWLGTADRLAYVHPSGVLELLGGETLRHEIQEGLTFVTAVGPRSYWPQKEAESYRDAVKAFRPNRSSVEDVALAATALVGAARQRESTWSQDEWLFRILASVTAWIYWDDEPGAARAAVP